MPIDAGLKLGRYEIVGPIGAGGMGEVYKAKDTRLDRIVALKVLPNGVANNPDLRQRLEREAKAISSLNHPNICTLFDAGHENGVDFLVMEYIEGETLANRLAMGPLQLAEVLPIAAQIADALDKAHRQGLVHRDLKPANIMLTKGGAKLLDFGLAKLQQEGVIQGTSGITRTTPLTGEGSIVGTLQYMSPEQLEAREVDARSDIFSFGAVLYEMVAGKRAFDGKSQASLIAAIMEREPTPISSISPMSPPGLDRLVRKCLKKDPEERWQSARDMSDELRWISQSGSMAGVPVQVSVQRKLRFRIAWLIAAVAGIAAIALAALLLTQKEPERSVRRLFINPAENNDKFAWPRISPDGKLLAFFATDTLSQSSIWIRPLNSLQAYQIPGTLGAERPFWSPDSRFLAFFVGRQLKKAPVAGGPVQLICETDGADGSWGTNGIILFDWNVGNPIRKVAASGGAVTNATELKSDLRESLHAWPCWLPGGEHFLYLVQSDSSAIQSGAYKVRVGSIDGSVSKELFMTDSRVEYSMSGHILYVIDGVLMAQPFDAGDLSLRGEAVPIGQNVAGDRAADARMFSVADDGTLVYQTGEVVGNSRLLWVSRKGELLDSIGLAAQYQDISISPDGKRVAYGLTDRQLGTEDIWIYDLERRVPTRLTFDPANEVWPVWSPDGTRVVYAGNPEGTYQIFIRSANGLGEPQSLKAKAGAHYGPSHWSRDGAHIALQEFQGDWDIILFNVADSSRSIRFTDSNHGERRPQFSPNGRYLAYQSNESGRPEIYVREIGGSGGRWQVSADGGNAPQWRADGKELYYVNLIWDFNSVSVNTEGVSFQAGIPEKLFNMRYSTTSTVQNRYAVTSDGQRFLVNAPLSTIDQTAMVVTFNWDAELEKP